MVKKRIKQIGCFFLLVIGFLCVWRIHVISGSLASQQGAGRWSSGKEPYAQVSAFFLKDAGIDETAVNNYRSQMQKSLEEASIESENKKARLWVDGYSAMGESYASRNESSEKVDIIGVGGDFFLFHPQEWLSGYYFLPGEAMKDRVVIDENLSWKLFGSYDVEGMDIRLGGKRCVIAGVYRPEEGREEDAAIQGVSKVFIPMELFRELNGEVSIVCYEILLPNPVRDFARQMVLKNVAGIDLSGNVNGEEEVLKSDIVVVENSRRYSVSALFTVLKNMGIRSMNRKSMEYPYWENIARANEDYCSYLLLGGVFCFTPPFILAVSYGVKRWKRRKWTVKRLVDFLLEKREEKLIKKWEEKKNEENEF